jgi:transposase
VVSILSGMSEYTGYRYRLYPTSEQAALLERRAGCARAVWNAALEQRRAAWRMNRTSLRYESQGGAELSQAKRAHPWLSEPHADACGHTDDADVNAAKSILAAGQVVTARGALAAGRGDEPRTTRRERADVA